MAQNLTEKSGPLPLEARVVWQGDVFRAAQAAQAYAATLGFSPQQCGEISLVVTELASNLVRHASGGVIALSPAESGPRTGIEIQSRNFNSAKLNLDLALTDGYSTVGGLGCGLGTVHRLMDDLSASSARNGRLLLTCRRWLRPKASASTVLLPRLAFGAATRSFSQLPENGDTFVFKQWDGKALAGVIDGLGHGPFAQRASQTARLYIEQHFDQPLEDLFTGVGRACRTTRGVVMALANFDLSAQKLTVASVGNITMRLVGGPGNPFNPKIRRGIVGLNAPQAAPSSHPWTSTSLLVMHSDGLRADWDWQSFREEKPKPPSVIAQRLLAELARQDDDATVIVTKAEA